MYLGSACSTVVPASLAGSRRFPTMPDLPLQVMATLPALQLIETLQARHGDLLFHQSGGCCDGSSPMCFAQGDFIVGDRDVRMGEIGGAPFYISPAQFEYWKHTQLIIDVVPGRGGMFSLENGEGVRFLVRSRLFSDEEFARLKAAGRV
jgi:uncharacterized protein (DUF779 family)